MLKSVLPLIAGTMLAVNAFAASESYTLDPTHTYPHFAVSHLGFSTMYGRFNKSSGKFTIDRDAKSGTIELTIEAASVDTGFQKRDDHLRGPDFFNATEFPTIAFRASAVNFQGDKLSTVDGDLTLHGQTKRITITIDSTRCAEHPMDKKKFVCGFNASTQIKRSEFGMTYGVPAIGDDVRLFFEVEGARD